MALRADLLFVVAACEQATVSLRGRRKLIYTLNGQIYKHLNSNYDIPQLSVMILQLRL